MSKCVCAEVQFCVVMMFAVSWEVVFRVQQLTAPHGGLAAPAKTESNE